MKFITYGIHTRLHYLIKKTGGIDKNIRKKYIKEKYNYTDKTIELIINHNFEEWLKDFTIEEITTYLINEKEIDRKKAKSILNDLSRMVYMFKGKYF